MDGLHQKGDRENIEGQHPRQPILAIATTGDLVEGFDALLALVSYLPPSKICTIW